MRFNFGGRLGRTVLASLACLAGATAHAQTWPTRPITMIVPLPPGGAVDILARVIAEPMQAALGQPVLVDNVAGAGSSIGVDRAARATPDGYTLGFGTWANYVIAGAVYPVRYDVLRDLEPVGLVADAPYWIVARNSMPAANMAELLSWLKSNPDKATAGTVGAGSGAHICGVYLQTEAHVKFQMAPYRGGAPALQDLMGGQIDFMCDLGANTLPMVRGGQIKSYAVMAKKRWSAAPDTPTIEEMGLPGLYLSAWSGIWAPRGTPREAIAKLNAALGKALADPAIRQKLAGLGQEPFPETMSSPEALGAFHKAEVEKWFPIVKAANIKVE